MQITWSVRYTKYAGDSKKGFPMFEEKTMVVKASTKQHAIRRFYRDAAGKVVRILSVTKSGDAIDPEQKPLVNKKVYR